MSWYHVTGASTTPEWSREQGADSPPRVQRPASATGRAVAFDGEATTATRAPGR